MNSADEEGYGDDSKVGLEKHDVERVSIAFRAVNWED
jgi:hypothetical protein